MICAYFYNGVRLSDNRMPQWWQDIAHISDTVESYAPWVLGSGARQTRIARVR